MTFIRQSVHSLCQVVKQRSRHGQNTALTVQGRTIGGNRVSEHWNALGSIGKDRWFCLVAAVCGMDGVFDQDKASGGNIGDRQW